MYGGSGGVRRGGAEFSQDLTWALEHSVSSCHRHMLPCGTDGLSDRYV